MASDTRKVQHPPRRIGCLALVLNTDDAVLMVKPSYKPGWILPGGAADANQPPHEACARQLRHETGLTLPSNADLLVVHHIPPNPNGDPTEGINIVFYAGTIDAATSITLPQPDDGEPPLSGYSWVTPAVLDDHALPYQQRRVRAALQARATGQAAYLYETA
ncbi:NUDIX domain-containing protein [Streptomyces sp. NPDC059373]